MFEGDSAEIFVASELVRQLIIGIICGLGSTGGYEWFKNTFLKTCDNTKVITVVPNDQCKKPDVCESCEPCDYNRDDIDENQNSEE